MQNRFLRLYKSLEEKKIDAFLVSNTLNIHYLTGFSGSSGYLLLIGQKRLFYTDARYYERALKETVNVKVCLLDKDISEILIKFKIKKLAFESNYVSYNRYIEWSKKFTGIKLIPVDSLVEKIRQIKDADEVRLITKAVDVCEEIFSSINLKKGITEKQLVSKLENTAIEVFSARPSFDPIVAFGRNSSIPHALPGKAKYSGNGICLIDFGVKVNGYSSDLTRTFWAGKITQQFKEIYNIVLEAQQSAIEGIKPGKPIVEIDKLARSYIDKYGYGKYFSHSLGHGIGLAVHELPRINPKSKGFLEEGMIFSVEPGIYITGWGGVRIEDLVLVKRDGCEVLTKLPKILKDIII